MDEKFTLEPVDRQGVQLLSASGVHVVAIADKRPSTELLKRAKNVLREAAPHPLEVRAIALSPELHLSPRDVMVSADEGFAFVRDEGESALARARNYMTRMLKLRADALLHLERRSPVGNAMTSGEIERPRQRF